MDWVTIGAFLFGIVVPVFLWGTGWGLPDAASEKRTLSRAPVWKWNRKVIDEYPHRFNAYFNDRFGFRSQLIQMHSRLLNAGLKMSPSKRVILGEEGWLYYNGVPTGDGDSMADFRGLYPLGPRDLEKWRWTFQDMQEWLDAQRIKFLVVIVPDKPLVYPEFMPDRYTPVSSVRPVDQVVDYLAEKTEVKVLNLNEVLVGGRQQEETYLKTDTHWNDFGAYLGYKAIMETLGEWFPVLQPAKLSDYSRKEVKYSGDLAQIMALEGVLNETFSALIPKSPRRASMRESDGRLPDRVGTLKQVDLPKMLMYRDSFCESLIPYLSEHFREARYRWNDWGFDPRVILREKPDLVVLQTGDRRLRRHLKLDASVSKKLAKERFESSASTLFTLNADTGFTGIEVLDGAELEAQPGGLRVKATMRYPHLQLPAVEDCDVHLPLMRIDLTAPRRTDLEIKWDSDEANSRSAWDPWVSAKLVKGRNIIYLPLRDPTMSGPILLDPGVGEGTYMLHEIEVRSIPR